LRVWRNCNDDALDQFLVQILSHAFCCLIQTVTASCQRWIFVKGVTIIRSCIILSRTYVAPEYVVQSTEYGVGVIVQGAGV